MVLILGTCIITFLIVIVVGWIIRQKDLKNNKSSILPKREIFKDAAKGMLCAFLASMFAVLAISELAQTAPTIEVCTRNIAINENGQALITNAETGRGVTYNINVVFEDSENVETVYYIEKENFRFTEDGVPCIKTYEAKYLSKFVDFIMITNPANIKILYLPKKNADLNMFKSTSN